MSLILAWRKSLEVVLRSENCVEFAITSRVIKVMRQFYMKFIGVQLERKMKRLEGMFSCHHSRPLFHFNFSPPRSRWCVSALELSSMGKWKRLHSPRDFLPKVPLGGRILPEKTPEEDYGIVYSFKSKKKSMKKSNATHTKIFSHPRHISFYFGI